MSLAGATGLRVELAGLLEPLYGVLALPILLVGEADVNRGVGSRTLIGSSLMI